MSSRTFNALPPQMATSSYGHFSRSNSNSNPPAGIIQLETWATNLASLTPSQKQSVDRLNEWLKFSNSGRDKGKRKEQQMEQDQRLPEQQIPIDPTAASAQTSNRLATANDHLNGYPNGLEASTSSIPSASSSTNLFQSLPQPLPDSTSFLQYYSTLSTHLSNSTKSSNETALNQLVQSTRETEDLLLELERAKVNLAELKAGIKAVEEADGLRERAEGMLERMDHLHNLSSSLSLRLSYFDILQPSTTLLSSPSMSLVTSPDFLHMLDRLDVALAFIRAHPHFRDSNLYKMRFEGCLIRAGTLIKMWVMRKVREVGADVSVAIKEKKDGKEFDLTSNQTLLHSKFESLGRDLRVLISELEKRAFPILGNDFSSQELSKSTASLKDGREKDQAAHEETGEDSVLNPNAPEFTSLLSESRVAYLSMRRSLLLPLVQSHINKLVSDLGASSLSPLPVANESSRLGNLISLIMKGFEYVDQVGAVERGVFADFFGLDERANGANRRSQEGPIKENEEALRVHLEVLCDPFYSILRPKIQSQNEVETLATVCSALLKISNSSAALTRPILKESQNRLLARAQNICKNEIQEYKPKEGELDYPKRLLGTKEESFSPNEAAKAQHRRAKSSIGGAGLLEAAAEAEAEAAGTGEIDVDSSNLPSEVSIRLFAAPSSEVLSTWYPPLFKLLSLLSQVYQKAPTSVFSNFASSSINSCRLSLSRDYESMSQSLRMGENGYDPPLFFLRHLFLLREMVTSVELASRPEQVSNSKADWMEGGSQMEQEGLLSSATNALSFTTVVDALNSLWSSTGALFYPKNLYDLATRASSTTSQGLESGTATPTLSSSVEGEIFKKPLSALERDIQKASAKLIDLVVTGSVLPLKMFLDHASVKKEKPDQEQLYLSSKELAAKPETSLLRATSAIQGFKTSSESTLKEAVRSMRAYLEDEKVVEGMLAVILQRITSTYSPFRKLVSATYSTDSELVELLSEDEMRAELERGLEQEQAEKGSACFISI